MGVLKVWNPTTSQYEAVAGGPTVRDEANAVSVPYASEMRFPSGAVQALGGGVVRVREAPTGVMWAKMVRAGGNQTIATGTATFIDFDTVEKDTDGFASLATDRFTIPVGLSGSYLLGMTVRWQNVAGGQRVVTIRKNSTVAGVNGTILVSESNLAADVNAYKGQSVSIPADLVAGDTVTYEVYHNLGSDTFLLDDNSFGWLVKLGSGNVSGLDTARARRTSGNLSFSSTSWANLDTGLDLVVPARAGDVLLVQVSALWQNQNIAGYLDVATVVAGSPVNYISGGGGASDEGLPGWFCLNNEYEPISGGAQYIVQSGDISGGTVTLRLRCRTGTSGTKTIYATATDPFVWSVVNLRGGAASRDIGYEFAYAEDTTGVAVTATTEGTANTVVAAPAVVFDGNTAVIIEYYSPAVRPDTGAAGRTLSFYLYDGTSIGLLARFDSQAANAANAPVYARRRLTPSAGSHTYSVRAAVSQGTGSISGGAGGNGANMPGYIRITKA